ncbi:MAG: hypothetical protein NTV05_16420 [Acidobacteria bacterium]|nr:hypothetical protein [Acidobacteriota bacterium]
MTDVEQIWREKSDDDLLVAAGELDTYEEEGQRAIRDELRRRGLEDPVDQARFLAPEEAVVQPEDGDEPPARNPMCLRCEVPQRYLGARWFRQAADAGALTEHKPMFEINQSFDMYVCPGCGHVDMYVGGGDTDIARD